MAFLVHVSKQNNASVVENPIGLISDLSVKDFLSFDLLELDAPLKTTTRCAFDCRMSFDVIVVAVCFLVSFFLPSSVLNSPHLFAK